MTMAVERKSFISAIEPTDSGVVQVRVGLRTILDGRVIETLWHRTIVEPGTDPESQMAALNADIAVLNTGPWPEVDTKSVAALSAVCQVVQPPDVVQEFQKARAEDIAVKQAAAEDRLAKK